MEDLCKRIPRKIYHLKFCNMKVKQIIMDLSILQKLQVLDMSEGCSVEIKELKFGNKKIPTIKMSEIDFIKCSPNFIKKYKKKFFPV